MYTLSNKIFALAFVLSIACVDRPVTQLDPELMGSSSSETSAGSTGSIDDLGSSESDGSDTDDSDSSGETGKPPLSLGDAEDDRWQCFHDETVLSNYCHSLCSMPAAPCSEQLCHVSCEVDLYKNLIELCGFYEPEYLCMFGGLLKQSDCIEGSIQSCGTSCDALCSACFPPIC